MCSEEHWALLKGGRRLNRTITECLGEKKNIEEKRQEIESKGMRCGKEVDQTHENILGIVLEWVGERERSNADIVWKVKEERRCRDIKVGKVETKVGPVEEVMAVIFDSLINTRIN